MEKKNEPFFDKFKSLEKLIYSVKYLPQILFFGSIGFFFYAFFIVGGENLEAVVGKTIAEYKPRELIFLPFTGFCLYITLLALINYRTKREFGGKGCWRR